jgi:hypothetical protein
VDRTAAARTLGVPARASASDVERAFRRLARVTHPDRYPPGSEAAEDATYRMQALVEARRTLLTAPDPSPGAAGSTGSTGTAGPSRSAGPANGRSDEDVCWAWHDDPSLPAYDERFPSDQAIDRRMRTWGLAWGGFLLVSAIVCALVGAAQPTNDALPLWSPALALGGAVALTIGVRAHRRLRHR